MLTYLSDFIKMKRKKKIVLTINQINMDYEKPKK